jgi:hypothetical protein
MLIADILNGKYTPEQLKTTDIIDKLSAIFPILDNKNNTKQINSTYKFYSNKIQYLINFLDNNENFAKHFDNTSLGIETILGYTKDQIMENGEKENNKSIGCSFQKQKIPIIFPFNVKHNDNIPDEIGEENSIFDMIYNVDTDGNFNQNNDNNALQFLLNYLNLLKNQLIAIKYDYLSFNQKIQNLYNIGNDGNYGNKANSDTFYTQFNSQFETSKKENVWGSFFDKNMRFYNHIIREWNHASYNNLSNSKGSDKCIEKIIKTLLNYPQFDNDTLNEILKNDKEIDIDFLQEEFKHIKMGYPYYYQVAKQFNDYHNEMLKVNQFFNDDKLKQLGFQLK